MLKVSFESSMRFGTHYDPDFAASHDRWQLARQLYEQNFRTSVSGGASPLIPKIIHQIWVGGEIPSWFDAWRQSWVMMHPDWDYRLWTDESVREFPVTSTDIYNKTASAGPKSDILRYAVLEKYGGVYIDVDFECLQPLDTLHGMGSLYAGFLDCKPAIISGALLGAAPHHPVIQRCLDGIREPVVTRDPLALVKALGPHYFTRHCFELACTQCRDMLFLPLTYFYPFPRERRAMDWKVAKSRYTRPESVAIHYWSVSWTCSSNGARKGAHAHESVRRLKRLLRKIPGCWRFVR